MNKLSPSRIAAACLAVAAWLPLHASAGLLDDDEARRAILDLRTKVENLTKDVNTRLDTKSDKTATLDMLNQHEQTMQELARLRGQIEVLANQVANAEKHQKDYYTDLDARLKKLEPRQETIDGQPAQVMPSEKSAYDAAFQQVKSGDYKGGAAAMQEFVRRYPESAYASNAQYWLGNAYFAQGDYKNAIGALEVVATTYKDSVKAPDALLNIASSYALLKDKKAAKKTLKELVTKFPDSTAAQTAKDRLAALK
jgi:tol-pal system protein YbgF